MRKTFQSEWQNIRFSEFAKTSSKSLAGSEFYQAFYEIFFSRYRDWSELSAEWLEEKERCAEFIVAQSEGSHRALSVGCGLGVMEHYLRLRRPDLDLYIHEVAPAAWRWIGAELPDERKLLGLIPACLPDQVKYGLVYLSAIDYVLDDETLIGLLAAIRPFLSDVAPARCLLISASFDETPGTLPEYAKSMVQSCKAGIAAALDVCKLRPRGQFWGWSRTREEYQLLMQKAGYQYIQEGFIDPEHRMHYWISGQ